MRDAVIAHTLYTGPLQPRHDRTRDGARCGGRHHRHTSMGLFGRDHPRWNRADMVGHRTRMGEFLLVLRPERRSPREVRSGSIASLWPSADYFRSSPGSGHRHGPLCRQGPNGYCINVSGFLTGQLRAANCTDPGEALLELDHLAAPHEQDKAHRIESSGRCARMDAEQPHSDNSARCQHFSNDCEARRAGGIERMKQLFTSSAMHNQLGKMSKIGKIGKMPLHSRPFGLPFLSFLPGA
jgi:hypothetical protein